jgi:hypothetical protein
MTPYANRPADSRGSRVCPLANGIVTPIDASLRSPTSGYVAKARPRLLTVSKHRGPVCSSRAIVSFRASCCAASSCASVMRPAA